MAERGLDAHYTITWWPEGGQDSVFDAILAVFSAISGGFEASGHVIIGTKATATPEILRGQRGLFIVMWPFWPFFAPRTFCTRPGANTLDASHSLHRLHAHAV